METLLARMQELVYADPESDIARCVDLISSIPGAGFLTAVTLAAEIGDPAAFSSARKLSAFLGIDPGVRQSGHYESRSCRMSKRGSPHARRALYTLAKQSIRTFSSGPQNPVLRTYYDARCKSKPPKVVIGAIMHKLVSIIYAVLRDREPYRPLTAEEHAARFSKNQQASFQEPAESCIRS